MSDSDNSVKTVAVDKGTISADPFPIGSGKHIAAFREQNVDDLLWFKDVLVTSKMNSATDIFVLADKPVRVGILKECFPVEPLIKPTAGDICRLLEVIMPVDIEVYPFVTMLDSAVPYVEFAFSVKNYGRFRVSCSTSNEGIGLAIRKLPYTIPSLDSLDRYNFLDGIKKMLDFKLRAPSGLILHTGTTGSGKSTLIASEIDFIASRISGAIYTLENPIEYVYMARKAFIRQYEVPRHMKSFLEGIRMSLRNNLSAAMIGEVRTRDEAHALFDAAMRGCLVFSTVHTSNVMNTIRFLDGMASDNKDAWRQMVAYSLRAIVSQKLIYKEKSGGFILVPEVFIPDSVARTKIALGKYVELENMWNSNHFKDTGSISFSDSLNALYQSGAINDREKEELKETTFDE